MGDLFKKSCFNRHLNRRRFKTKKLALMWPQICCLELDKIL